MTEPVLYRERLSLPFGLWAAWAGFVLSLAFVLLVALPATAVLGGCAVLAVVGAALLRRGETVLEVRGDELVAGRARLPLACAGPPLALDGQQAAAVRGPRFDPRAFHVLRGWISEAVVVPVQDQDDPTPYWYLSTRSPARLAAAVETARETARD